MMDETTALNGTTTITKEKQGSTPLVVLFTFTITLLLVGLAFYAGQPIHGGTSLAAAGSGGTTRGGSITAASLMMSNDDDSVKGCVTSVGTFDFCNLLGWWCR